MCSGRNGPGAVEGSGVEGPGWGVSEGKLVGEEAGEG